MTRNQLLFAAALLDIASDSFSNHVCNDFELSYYVADVNERRALMREYHQWNGDLENFDPELNYDLVMDFALMSFLAHKLRKMAEDLPATL